MAYVEINAGIRLLLQEQVLINQKGEIRKMMCGKLNVEFSSNGFDYCSTFPYNI